MALVFTLDWTPKALVDNGFLEKEGTYYKDQDLIVNDLVWKVTYSWQNTQVAIRVQDQEGEDYDLVHVEGTGSLLARGLQDAIKDQVETWINQGRLSPQINDLLQWAQEQLGVKLVMPFKDSQAQALLTPIKGKWLALMMDLPLSKFNKELLGSAQVLNVKIAPEDREWWYGQRMVFPAYHMNKIHWVSIALTPDQDFDLVKEALAKARDLVDHKK